MLVGIALENFKYAIDGIHPSSFVKDEEVKVEYQKLPVLKEMEKKGLIKIEKQLPSRGNSDLVNELNEKIDELTKENEDLKSSQGDDNDLIKKEKENIQALLLEKLDIDIDKRKSIVSIVSGLIDHLTEVKPSEQDEGDE